MLDFWKLIPHATLLSGVFAMLLGAITSFIAIPVIVRICKVKGLTDKPNDRTSHNGSIPSLGGVAIFSGVLLGSALLMPTDHLDDPFRYIIASTFVLFLVGQKDDILGISWKKKLMAEICASLILIVLGNIRFTSLFGLAGIHEIPPIASLILTLVIFVGIINAFNLIDGIDGLASGTGIVASFLMGSWMYGIGEHGMAVIAWALTGSLIPFFYFNVFGEKYKLFMGDTGSLMIGLLMGLFAAVICGKELPADHILFMKAAPSVLIAILIYPLYDMIRVFTIRIAHGISPFKADRAHVHHLFLDAGYSHRRSTFYILVLNVMAIFFALVLRNASILVLGLSLLAAAIFTTLVVREIGRRRIAKAVDDGR
ncbi:MAG: MraY family glycosyltransferase [Bacteroidales bacterium]|jgi:UDP-N-acetylmuramyl pentapeptide phosphotransferase/UDP-N-acetylglucosamine-1-phosphate transferase